MDKDIIDEAISAGKEIIEIYKAGFLDGYIAGKRTQGRFANESKVWHSISPLAIKAFQKRFMHKVARKTGKVVKL